MRTMPHLSPLSVVTATLLTILMPGVVGCTGQTATPTNGPEATAYSPPETTTAPAEDDPLGVGPPIQLPADLNAGQCLRESDGGDRVVITIADCADASYDHQIISLVPITEASYPGDDGVFSQAAGRTMGFISPDQAMWDQGRHTIICVASPAHPGP